MAKYLSNIDLNKNQLQNPVIHSLGTAPATPVEGQIYFDSTAGDKHIYLYNGTAWVQLSEGAHTSDSYVSNVSLSGTDLTFTGVGSAFNGTVDLSSLDEIVNNSTITINAGNYLSTGGSFTLNQATNATITIDHDTTSRTDTTSTDAPGYGGTFQAVTSVTTNTYGHVTAIDVSTVTIPASDNTNNYVDGISFSTSTGVLTLSRLGLADLTQDLDGRYLELSGGTMTGDIAMGSNSITGLVDPTNAQDAATKAYVDAATVGGLVYQGGYNAATNTPNLDSNPSPNNIEKGWTYTVTADGSFFTEQVRVGDVLIAENDAPTTLAEWTTVQNNIDLASLTQIGIGNVIAATAAELDGLSVTYSSGTATVGFDVDSLTQSTPTSNADAFLPYYDDAVGENKKLTFTQLVGEISGAVNAKTTASGTITAGSTSGTVTHNFSSNKVIVQTYLDNATDNYPVVYCDITRTANSVTATIATAETDDIIILVQAIG